MGSKIIRRDEEKMNKLRNCSIGVLCLFSAVSLFGDEIVQTIGKDTTVRVSFDSKDADVKVTSNEQNGKSEIKVQVLSKVAKKNCCAKKQCLHPDTTNWKSLFKKDLSNAICPKGVWGIDKNGILFCKKDQAIWTDRSYENFILDFEYQYKSAGNSGALFYCAKKFLNNWTANAIEVQILDDDRYPANPLYRKTGSLYGHLGPKESVAVQPGTWGRMTITAKGKKIRVVANGKLAVEGDLSTMTSAQKNPDGTSICPWLNRPWSTLPTKGHIGFQGTHGSSAVRFRSIKIKEL